MKVAKYWARESTSAKDIKGYKYHLVSWSGSNLDLAEAKTKAIEKLEGWKTLLKKGRPLGDYPYADKDTIREELLTEQFDGKGNLVAAITRNRYGALVLNSANTLFADVDLPVQHRKNPSFFNGLLSFFRKSEKGKDNSQNEREDYRKQFAEFHNQNPELVLRVYETYAGFRLIILNKLFDPLSEEAHSILKQLNSDELYIRLCRSQECFRARLTPKPWRCNFKAPPNNYPREDVKTEEKHLRWLQVYEDKAKDYGVCQLVEEFGDGKIEKSALKILQLHDKYVLNLNSKELA